MNEAEIAAMPTAAIWYLSHAIVAAILYRIIYDEPVHFAFVKLFKGKELGSERYRAKQAAMASQFEQPKKKRVEHPDDYWEGEVNYDTGEIITDGRPSVRHPKNRDRAYSGSA